MRNGSSTRLASSFAPAGKQELLVRSWTGGSGPPERPVTTLSGGELQRVRIARALAQEPRALALDEPTASLDISHKMTIFGLLRRWADRGMTVLLITHQLNLAARFADRVVLLHRGRVAAQGPLRKVLREETMEKVYRWPLHVDCDPVVGAPRVVPLDPPPGKPG